MAQIAPIKYQEYQEMNQMSDTEDDEELIPLTVELIPLIVKRPVDVYKTTLIYASNIPEIGKYINSYSIYFKDSLWLVIQFESTSREFSMIYTSKRMFITGPFKTREYIIYNTPYVVNRPNQPLYIIISSEWVHVMYEKRYRDVLYNSHFEFYERCESKVSELQLMTMVNNKK